MSVEDKIHRYVQRLPDRLQAEVLDDVERRSARAERADASQDEREWASLSLSLAMRDIEDEDGPEYTAADLKERFPFMAYAVNYLCCRAALLPCHPFGLIQKDQ